MDSQVGGVMPVVIIVVMVTMNARQCIQSSPPTATVVVTREVMGIVAAITDITPRAGRQPANSTVMAALVFGDRYGSWRTNSS